MHASHRCAAQTCDRRRCDRRIASEDAKYCFQHRHRVAACKPEKAHRNAMRRSSRR